MRRVHLAPSSTTQGFFTAQYLRVTRKKNLRILSPYTRELFSLCGHCPSCGYSTSQFNKRPFARATLTITTAIWQRNVRDESSLCGSLEVNAALENCIRPYSLKGKIQTLARLRFLL